MKGGDSVAAAERPSEKLLDAALRLLSARQRGAEELRSRLRKKGFGAGEVADCLRWLQERGLIDDRAYSRAFVRDRLNFSPRSPYLLKRELRLKGIADPVASDAVAAVLEEEGVSEVVLAEATARTWVRKQGTRALAVFTEERFSEERERERRRFFGFMSRRGFRAQMATTGLEAGIDEARKLLQ
jgi:regulatory protein